MGTIIELNIGDVSLSSSKNAMGVDYGYMFQDGDLCRRKTDAINYDYYEEHPEEKEDIAKVEELFVRKLSDILPRLEILGYTLEAARTEYQSLVAEANSATEDQQKEYLTFDEFCSLICRYPLNAMNSTFIEHNTPDRDIISQGRFANYINEFNRIPLAESIDLYWSEASFFSEKVVVLSAESMLQVFALNKANTEIEVTWEFGPIVHSGWVKREEFQTGARQRQQILIATEGPSDANIIRLSLDILRPDLADFFNFIDVTERHHFWGASNLVKFAEGLLRINIMNQVLFVFDNDAEGVDAFYKLKKINLPANMRAMLLPDLEEFRSFSTYGPEGISISDINGRAAAIECYLDLDLPQYSGPRVTWSNFKKDIGVWHGALDFKKSYSNHFYKQTNDLLHNSDYDMSKLLRLIDEIVSQAGLIVPVI